MNILYVYAHPDSTSLNAKLMRAGVDALVAAGHHVELTDLYAISFPAAATQFTTIPTTTQTELEKIARADHLILQFPLWWFSVPAILKGWMDSVFLPGHAYDTGKTFKNGYWNKKTASLSVTTQSTEAAYQADGVHGSQIENFLLPVLHALRFTGITTEQPFIAYQAFGLDDQAQQDIVTRYKNYLANLPALQAH